MNCWLYWSAMHKKLARTSDPDVGSPVRSCFNMAFPRIVYLMYHELELAGRKLRQSDPGYVRYILPRETFRSQMEWLKRSRFLGLNVSEALAYPTEPSVCITFDDGCDTDLIASAPILRECEIG